MANRYHCSLEQATVREDKQEALEGLIRKMFDRRHHGYVEGQEKEWLRLELIQSLREVSQIYRDRLSSKTSGPLPFALGYFRLRDDRLELVSDRIPANVDPEPLARVLSEFLEPGAVLWCWEEQGERDGWEICGVGKIIERSAAGEADHAQEGADEESVGASS